MVFGSTLKIHYEPAMAGEQRVIEYINQHIAPDYGLTLEAVGVQDPVQADRAVADGGNGNRGDIHDCFLDARARAAMLSASTVKVMISAPVQASICQSL